MKNRFFAFLLAFILLVPLFSASAVVEEELDIEELIETTDSDDTLGVYETDGSTVITVTCTGDFTIGGDNYHKKNIFKKELNKHDGDINFTMANVRDIFLEDDMTLVNFEGTLTNTKYVPDKKKGNSFLFNIDPIYVSVLPDNGIEAVSLENNHVMDHGEEGYEDTKNALTEAEDFQELIDLQAQNKTVREIAAETGFAPTTVHRKIKKALELGYKPSCSVPFHSGVEQTEQLNN